MNEAHTNALLAALEGQRNTALNHQANFEAALIIAKNTIREMEQQINRLKANQIEAATT